MSNYLYMTVTTFTCLKLNANLTNHDDVIKRKHYSALLALCVGNLPVTGELPPQRPVTQGFDVSFDLRLNKRLSKHREAGDLRRICAHYDVTVMYLLLSIPCVLYKHLSRLSQI